MSDLVFRWPARRFAEEHQGRTHVYEFEWRLSRFDLDRLVEYDIAFHQAIARASGNALFHQIVRSFEQLMRVAVPNASHTRETSAQRDLVLTIHRDLAQAIADRDSAATIRLMDAHFNRSI